MSNVSLAHLLAEIQEQPRCADWGAKLQHACDILWSALDSSSTTDVDSKLVDTLISVLQQEDAFALARLVVPEFRMKEPSHRNPLKQRILDQTLSHRLNALAIEETQQSDFDTHLYRQEKEVFTEAEMYRASLLLFGSAAFNEVEEQEIIEWLDKRPKKSCEK